jgi:hypothetical protein
MEQGSTTGLNRAARRRAAREARSVGARSPRSETSHDDDGVGEPHFLTINNGPDYRNASCRVITESNVNPLTDTVTFNSVALEDTIHPVELAFEPPYMILAAAGGAKVFQRMWEKLTYAFRLPVAEAFPALPNLSSADRETLAQYVMVCRKLAGYSALAHGGGFRMQWTSDDDYSMTSDFPCDEQLVALAARFRQLNNERDTTAFSRASGLIIKASKEHQPDLALAVSKWREARGALLNKNIATIVCEMLLPEGTRPVDPPIVSYGNLRPADLFNTYFYGDLLHVSDNAADLVDINSEDGNAAYHMFGFLTSMSALAHLYFGFAVLVEQALGAAPAHTEE